MFHAAPCRQVLAEPCRQAGMRARGWGCCGHEIGSKYEL
jgi:hypothetical protein